MRYYSRNRSGSSRFKKIMMRILFVLVAAAVITFLAILLGNYLVRKVEEANRNAAASSDFIGFQVERETGDPAEETSAYHSPDVFGAGIDLTSYRTQEAIRNDVQTLAETYDTLTVSLIGDDGELIYLSPALCELTRMPVPEDNPELDKLRALADTAKGIGMRLCAKIAASTDTSSVSSAAVIDGTLMNELATLGFDEILLTLSDDYTYEIDYDSANRIRAYLTECAKYSDCTVGVLLSSELYRNASMAKQVQLIASAATFLGIQFPMEAGSTTADVYRSVTGDVTNLMGSFSVYNMRVIIGDGEWGLMSAQYNACLENGVKNISFVSAVALDKLTYTGAPEIVSSANEEVPVPEAPESGEENPYASSSDDYEHPDEEAAEDSDSDSGANGWF